MSRRRLKRERTRKVKRSHRCGRTLKVRFASPAHASEAAVNIMAKPDCNAPGFRTYHCDFCNGWHLTSKV